MYRFFPGAAALSACLFALPAAALERLDGWFIATGQCDAYQSKNNQTNPGDVQTEFMRAYEMIAINKPGGDFFLVRIPDAPQVSDRWVHVSCGMHVVAADTPIDGNPPPDPGTGGPQAGGGSESTDNLLALSWQPAFCEAKPNKPECEALNDGQLPHTVQGLSIHGLWPQPRNNVYCGVSGTDAGNSSDGDWDLLPEVIMDAETRDALAQAMPGVTSHLERHEWIKHGTCYNGEGGADEYYDDTLALTAAINGSDVGAFLAANVGQEVDGQLIRDAFDRAFGAGAGERVDIRCDRDGSRTLLGELFINLDGLITETPDLGALLLNAQSTGPIDMDCARVVIDAEGLQ